MIDFNCKPTRIATFSLDPISPFFPAIYSHVGFHLWTQLLALHINEKSRKKKKPVREYRADIWKRKGGCSHVTRRICFNGAADYPEQSIRVNVFHSTSLTFSSDNFFPSSSLPAAVNKSVTCRAEWPFRTRKEATEENSTKVGTF